MQTDAPEMLGPTLVSGVACGALASLPYVKVFNACTCCSLVVLCGLSATYLYSRACRRDGIAFRPATGAWVGLVAGAFYGLTTGLLEPFLTAAWGEPGLRSLLERIGESPSTPPETNEVIDDLLERMATRTLTLGSTILGIFSSILVGAVFSSLGGLIGGAWFQVPPGPSATPPTENGSDALPLDP